MRSISSTQAARRDTFYGSSACPKGKRRNQINRVGKGGRRTDCMPPSSISSPHFSNSFPHGGMPGMWVVGKVFKNTPRDKNVLVLKTSLLAKRRCTGGARFPLSWTFGISQLYTELLDEILLAYGKRIFETGLCQGSASWGLMLHLHLALKDLQQLYLTIE